MSALVPSPMEGIEQSGTGLKVVLKRINGLTKKGILPSPFYFQIPPESFRHGYGHSHSDYEPLRGGQRSRPGSAQLATVSFRSMFIDYTPYWSLLHANPGQVWVPDPLEINHALIRICELGYPIRLIVHQPERWARAEIDMPATLRTVEIEEVGGEPDTRYDDVSFVQFRDTTVLRRATGRSNPKLPVTLVIRNIPKARRTLRGLAQHYYRSASKWRVIARHNRILTVGGTVIDPGKDLLLAWNVKKRKLAKITIPDLPDSGSRSAQEG